MPNLPTVVLAVAAVALPLPALAADPGNDGEDLAHAANAMRDPARQEQASRMAEAIMDAMLEMPIGKLIQAAATVSGDDAEAVDPEATLAEIAGPDVQDAPREFALAMPRMMDAMGVFADALGTMLPEMRKAGEEMARNMPEDFVGGTD